MPQMAPLMWVTLFWFFISILILFLTTNFFIKNYMPKSVKFSSKKISKNWKW